MKKVIWLMLLVVIGLFLLTGCGESEITLNRKEENDAENTISKVLNIEKIYYKFNDDSSASMYLVYSIKSDENLDIDLGSSASLLVGSKTTGSAFYSYDMNKNVFEKAGFPTVVTYKTLYSGSAEILKYVATFTINKKYIDNGEDIILKVPINGTVNENSPVTEYSYLEKSFKFTEITSFLYSDNSEFLQEFKKDYSIN